MRLVGQISPETVVSDRRRWKARQSERREKGEETEGLIEYF